MPLSDCLYAVVKSINPLAVNVILMWLQVQKGTAGVKDGSIIYFVAAKNVRHQRLQLAEGVTHHLQSWSAEAIIAS